MATLSLREELVREIERQEKEESIARRARIKEREAAYVKLRTQGLANLETILHKLTVALKEHARERTYQCVYPDTLQEYAAFGIPRLNVPTLEFSCLPILVYLIDHLSFYVRH
ncbi:MAG: hypothetical protein KGI50_07195 [Patescibacteria group bacterium]|nr:hypothetical protein [Patescibacteria group bacterium]MDE2439310.1 hypothetical protein [Patescibacteria group bacterium]